MDISYMYTKIRNNFGCQPMFSEVESHLLDNIPPNRVHQKDYVLRNPVHQESQAAALTSEHYINTPKVEYTTRGAEHLEGGWPKDIDFNDEEATARYRRRVERDDDYVHAVLTSVPKLEYFINQNNGIDYYQQYFKELVTKKKFEEPNLKFYNIFCDPRNQKIKQPISSIDWTSENHSKLVVAYSKKSFQINRADTDFTCYLWNVENCNEPLCEIVPPVACYQIACSPLSPDIIIGGLEDGRVCIFDIRESKLPIAFSQIHISHRDPVTALLYLQTRANNEFLSGSSDGTCIWYDIRNLTKPTDFLIMLIKFNIAPDQRFNLANAEPVNVLQFDQALPTRFLCGTGTGLVVNVNRKGKTHQDVMSGIYQAHAGPVKALHRSTCTSKMFITCGDWATHIWSEDIKTSPIIVGTSQRYQTQDVAWVPNRYSCYMTVGSDGKFRYWDILRKTTEPIITLRLAKCSLLNIKCSADGHFVAVGDIEGTVHLLSLSESMITPIENEKQYMMQVYERETRRENILELRIKSIRLKVKADQEGVPETEEVDDESLMKETENEYRRVVLEEIRRVDKIAWGG